MSICHALSAFLRPLRCPAPRMLVDSGDEVSAFLLPLRYLAWIDWAPLEGLDAVGKHVPRAARAVHGLFDGSEMPG